MMLSTVLVTILVNSTFVSSAAVLTCSTARPTSSICFERSVEETSAVACGIACGVTDDTMMLVGVVVEDSRLGGAAGTGAVIALELAAVEGLCKVVAVVPVTVPEEVGEVEGVLSDAVPLPERTVCAVVAVVFAHAPAVTPETDAPFDEPYVLYAYTV